MCQIYAWGHFAEIKCFLTAIIQLILFIVVLKYSIQMKLRNFCLRIIYTKMVLWNLYFISCYVKTLGSWEEWVFGGESGVASWREGWGHDKGSSGPESSIQTCREEFFLASPASGVLGNSYCSLACGRITPFPASAVSVYVWIFT